ncbi:antibiotic biosynthesis monooxygenase family protein [Bacillus suaedaesalsae]|uniref:Antibiotic biosynthesis monooxygenase n=1 Tax=Bacillus suaedaesalsae TaxID=2810349 RepID=A0ABS2DFG3_9BACI|nr:antibiotic biosynthesis monooxygenase [Bacillus suaedaesalsae]MBM6617189.1 antibiotic biosynthesis monooxygenase [Bacillus suaedaesalsae]
MNIYRTFGTIEYLSNLKSNHLNETMLLMLGDDDQALLLHETESSSIFNEGTGYEVIDGTGNLSGSGFAVFNNIPVSEEGRSIFEYRFKNRARLIENEPGFCAIRVLRPIKHDTYVILTLWDNESDFLNWQSSNAYNEAHKNRGTSEGIDKKSIFLRPSYVTKYNIFNENA